MSKQSVETFGERLRKKRLERRITQELLGERIGVDRASISQWEINKTQPKSRNLIAMAKVLEADVGWLQTGIETAPHDDFLNGLSADAIAIIQRVAELDRGKDERIPAFKIILGMPDSDLDI